jgi:hypothetical protein
MRVSIVLVMAMILAATSAGAVFAQDTKEAPNNPFSFKGGIDLGSDVLPTGPAGANEAWTRLGFQPDIGFGKFGVGIDLSARFKLYPTPEKAVELYPGDWVPDYKGNGKSVLDIYLPKIMYFRYGLKGEDPLFAKLGSIDDLSLGNGFIVGNYSNMRFMPATRIFGLNLGIDGRLFNFPILGFEALTGNLARFDVMGGRIFARPFIGTELPILKNMQVGVSAAFDTNPYLYADKTAAEKAAAETMAAYGLDLMVPILGGKLFPLAAFMDVAIDPNQTIGGMAGFGGRLIGIFNYGAQLRVLQDGFIPAYFDANYDLYRSKKYDFVQTYVSNDKLETGWMASLGTTFLEDKIVFNAALDGPFAAIPPVASPSAKQTDYPHAKAIFHFGEGIIGGIYFDASYEKYNLGKVDSFFKDLADPTDAVIGLAVNYKTGASVLTLKYDAKWNPDFDNGDGTFGKFDVSSSLSASMKF